MQELPPIPTPLSFYWKEMRWRGLPFLILFLILGLSAFTWNYVSHPATFAGHAETISATVSSADAGLLTNVFVTEFQEVRAGDIVAELTTTDPRTAQARLAVLRGRMHLMELEITPLLNRQRAALDYEKLSLDCSRLRVELATARINLERAEVDLHRYETLKSQGAVSDELYDLIKKTKEALEAEVQEKNILVTETQKTLERLSYMAESFSPGAENDPLNQALKLEEERVRLFQEKMRPIPLLAPIDGTVTALHRRAGEAVTPGEPLITITSHRAEKIIGYLPQYYSVTPKVGDPVTVINRSRERKRAPAKILAVGPHFLLLTNPLVAPIQLRPASTAPFGRTISISLPEELGLFPGEPVDISLTR